ncbi:MAG: GNAT family N-acetyltransferase [Spirochaetota bacterium]|nr:GNAT family N-acetyltransferase [Spirochaetota bacterium]
MKSNDIGISVRRATLVDVEYIYQIIKSYSDEDIILARTRSNIRKHIKHFLLAEIIDSHHLNEVAGVISYYDYGKELKEVRSLAVKRELCGREIGSTLLLYLVRELLNKYLTAKIFTLTYSPDFFRKFGFIEIPKETLPEKIWKDCRTCKNKDNCGEIALVFSDHKTAPI